MWLSSELWGRGEAIGGMTNGKFYYLVMDYLLIFIYLLVPRVPRKNDSFFPFQGGEGRATRAS